MEIFYAGLFLGAVASLILVGVAFVVEDGNDRVRLAFKLGLYLLLPGLVIWSIFVVERPLAIPGLFIVPIMYATLFWKKLQAIERAEQPAKDAAAAAAAVADEARAASTAAALERLAAMPSEQRKSIEQHAADAAWEASAREQRIRARLSAESAAEAKHGTLFPKVICPHCQTVGSIRKATRTRVTTTQTDSSLIGKIISPKARSESAVSELHCGNCDMTWNT